MSFQLDSAVYTDLREILEFYVDGRKQGSCGLLR